MQQRSAKRARPKPEAKQEKASPLDPLRNKFLANQDPFSQALGWISYGYDDASAFLRVLQDTGHLWSEEAFEGEVREKENARLFQIAKLLGRALFTDELRDRALFGVRGGGVALQLQLKRWGVDPNQVSIRKNRNQIDSREADAALQQMPIEHIEALLADVPIQQEAKSA